MADTRKLAAILAADVVGFCRLAGADEVGTISRLRALRHELIDPPLPNMTIPKTSKFSAWWVNGRGGKPPLKGKSMTAWLSGVRR